MHHDVAILGSGFGGSIAALIAKQLGMNPILIERGTHPRFAIGESSTPQANIALANISKKYSLPRLLPLARYGTWKKTHPHLACGSKRGFTFISHPNINDELLVAASPDEFDCDSHWYRADLDAFLVDEVVRTGIPYIDNTDISISKSATWSLTSENFSCGSDFIIDATGGGNPLDIQQDVTQIKTNSRSIFSHFENVIPWGELHGKDKHPYPCHDSALHHIFDGGWMYVLHFDNGITSAGFVLDNYKRPTDTWESLINEFPNIKEQFANATMIMPLVETERLQRFAIEISGDTWAMLPNSAYCIDPLYSTGIAHTLQCVDRLVQSIGDKDALHGYARQMRDEIHLIDLLIHGSYACMHEFNSFANYAMLYFSGADYSERQIREKQSHAGFLNSEDDDYRKVVSRFHQQAIEGKPILNLADTIEPWNMVGLCDPSKQNMYDYA